MTLTHETTVAPVTTLAPYTGPWERTQAAHLLRRASFAPSISEIDDCLSLGLEASLDRLFTILPLPEGPLYYDYDGHPDLGIGDSFAGVYLNPDEKSVDSNARSRSVVAWLYLTAAETGFNVREKMVLFWNNHFGIGGITWNNARIRTFNRYRTYAIGDFRQLVKEMTIEPYMLRFLDGATNTVTKPNENFAREILELFTLGKGEQVGPGEYTNYTEQDVTELARAFTGWRFYDVNTTDPLAEERSEFQANRHDTGAKQLSARFDNAVIENAGADEYADVVDLIFTKDEVASFLCRKLYRHFLYFDITPEVEANIIQPMARVLIYNDYTVAPALRALFASEHFYQATFIGAMIKTPIDFGLSLLRNTNFLAQPTVFNRYNAARQLINHGNSTGMNIISPPTVAGWTAYYQAPSYHRIWLNTTTIQQRTRFARQATRAAFYWDGGGYHVNWLNVIDALPDPFDATAVITDLADLLLPRPLAEGQFDYLYDLLLDGQQDFVWTNEYADYITNPDDEAGATAVNRRLDDMVFGMTELAEFQLF